MLADKIDGAKTGAACKNPPKKTRKPRSKKAAAKIAKTPNSDAARTAPAGNASDTTPITKPDATPDADTTPITKPDATPDADTTPVTVSNSQNTDSEPSDVPAKADDDAASDTELEPRVYTPEEIDEISRKVEVYKNNTPEYKPENILSREFGGTSNYERGIAELRAQKLSELEKLDTNLNTTDEEIVQAKDDIRTLDHLYENYYQGMNVFRTAKGGRSKLRI